jgi:hypothetical protein
MLPKHSEGNDVHYVITCLCHHVFNTTALFLYWRTDVSSVKVRITYGWASGIILPDPPRIPSPRYYNWPTKLNYVGSAAHALTALISEANKRPKMLLKQKDLQPLTQCLAAGGPRFAAGHQIVPSIITYRVWQEVNRAGVSAQGLTKLTCWRVRLSGHTIKRYQIVVGTQFVVAVNYQVAWRWNVEALNQKLSKKHDHLEGEKKWLVVDPDYFCTSETRSPKFASGKTSLSRTEGADNDKMRVDNRTDGPF